MPDRPIRLSVKVLVRDDAGRVLLLRRSSASKGNPGKWDLPGGKTDPAEAFDAAVVREVAEETGLTFTLGRVVGAAESHHPEMRVVYLIFEAHARDTDVTLSDEHDDFTWAPPADAAAMDLCPQFRQVLEEFAACTH